MTRVAFAIAAAVAYTFTPGMITAAPIAPLPEAVTGSTANITPVYYYHGRYYRYRWHGAYYAHRRYYHGHYRYY